MGNSKSKNHTISTTTANTPGPTANTASPTDTTPTPRSSRKNEIDLNIFNVNDDFCDISVDAISGCSSIYKLISSLTYYDKLCVNKNVNSQEIFNNFITTVYWSYLDDYNHFIHNHSKDIEIINKKLEKCDSKRCNFTERHFSDKSYDKNIDKNVLHPNSSFFNQFYDSLHFYFYHLFECGLRTKKMDKNDDEEIDDDDSKHDEFFDVEFSRMIRSINDRTYINNNFNRFKSNKFGLNTTSNTAESGESSLTFIDSVYSYLKMVDINKNIINLFTDYLSSQSYDSDSVEMDICDNNNNNDQSNIYLHCGMNQKLLTSINDRIENHKCFVIFFFIYLYTFTFIVIFVYIFIYFYNKYNHHCLPLDGLFIIGHITKICNNLIKIRKHKILIIIISS